MQEEVKRDGAKAITAFLAGPYEEKMPNLNDRDNFLILKPLTYMINNNQVACGDANEAEECLKALIN